MKKVLMALALLVFAVSAFAQTNKTEEEQAAKKEQQETVEGPMLKFEETTVDYGEIEQNADPYRVFKFTNVGTEPVVIKNAKGSCGCTVPDAPKEPILPGEEGEIKVRYDTKRVGPFTKTVTLTTNEATPTRTLVIKGKVNRPEEGLPKKKSSMFNNNGNN